MIQFRAPWKLYISRDVQEHKLYDATHRVIANIVNYDVSVEHADRERDESVARLIEATPDLLAAAKMAEALIRDGGVVPIKGVSWAALAAAIAKAEGRS